jgi:hypothetical protein
MAEKTSNEMKKLTCFLHSWSYNEKPMNDLTAYKIVEMILPKKKFVKIIAIGSHVVFMNININENTKICDIIDKIDKNLDKSSYMEGLYRDPEGKDEILYSDSKFSPIKNMDLYIKISIVYSSHDDAKIFSVSERKKQRWPMIKKQLNKTFGRNSTYLRFRCPILSCDIHDCCGAIKNSEEHYLDCPKK